MAKKIISLYRSNGLKTKVEKLQPPEQIISAEVTEKLNDSLTLSMVCVCTEYNVTKTHYLMDRSSLSKSTTSNILLTEESQ